MADIVIDEPNLQESIDVKEVVVPKPPSFAIPSASQSKNWYNADDIIDALKVNVNNKDKLSSLVHVIKNTSENNNINVKDFLRSVTDDDIKKYNLNNMKIQRNRTEQIEQPERSNLSLNSVLSEAPVLSPSAPVPQKTMDSSESPIVPQSFSPTEPIKRIAWGKFALAVCVAILIIIIGFKFISLPNYIECPDFCNISCNLLEETAVGKCTSCGPDRACNPDANGFHTNISHDDSSPVHGETISWMETISRQLYMLKNKTEGITKKFFSPNERKRPEIIRIKDTNGDTNVRILFDKGVTWTNEDRITFSSLNDSLSTITVYLHELIDVDNDGIYVVSLPEQKYFVTARAVGSRAHFQSSGVVDNDSIIRFGVDYVEVNAIVT